MPQDRPRPRKEFGKTIAGDIAHRLREEIVSCELKPGRPCASICCVTALAPASRRYAKR